MQKLNNDLKYCGLLFQARKRKLGLPDDEDIANDNDAAEETAALAVPKTNG